MTEEVDKKYIINDIIDIKNQVAHLNMDQKDILDCAEVFLEWKEYLKTTEEPKKFKEIRIDNFVLTYEEFKKLIDNKILSDQYYDISSQREGVKDIKELSSLLEKQKLDLVFPSLAKDGIFNMMIYDLAKHSPTSNNVEFHYIIPENRGYLGLANMNNNIENIISNSKNDKKVHFILTDNFSKKSYESGHVVPLIIMNEKTFMFDSMGWGSFYFGNGEFYSTGEFLQQTDNSSCRAMAVREVDNFLKILETFSSIEEFSNYLEQFFPTEDKTVQFIDPENLHGDLLENPEEDKKNKRLGIVPFQVLKFSQSISSLKMIRDFSKYLHENCKDPKKQGKIKHIVEMANKLDTLIERLETQKNRNNAVENEQINGYKNINYYALRERIRHTKILSILFDKGLIKKLENVESYKNNIKNMPVIATVDNKWLDSIEIKQKNDVEQTKTENEELEEQQIVLQNAINDTINSNDKVQQLNLLQDI